MTRRDLHLSSPKGMMLLLSERVCDKQRLLTLASNSCRFGDVRLCFLPGKAVYGCDEGDCVQDSPSPVMPGSSPEGTFEHELYRFMQVIV